MSVILSIETSTSVCSVALHVDGSLVAKHITMLPKSHIEYLMNMVDGLFKVVPYDKDKIDAVAVSAGPGSYTGLRIGVSVAKGLCYSLQVPLISVSTLYSMLYSVCDYNLNNFLLCPMIDANSMRVYCLISDSDMNILQQVKLITVNDGVFAECVGERGMIFFGNGALKCEKLFSKEKHFVFFSNIHPDADCIGKIAYDKFIKKDFEDYALFEPTY